MIATIIEPKPGVDMGRVIVSITVRNAEDVLRVQRGELKAEQIRQVSLEALVDSGATLLCIPEKLVKQLDLPFNRQRQVRTAGGLIPLRIYSGAMLDVQGRECQVEVMGLADESQALLGQIPLESLDYWIDTTNHRLVGNPEHGGQWMAEIY